MTHERESPHPEQPGAELAALLRRWWEGTGGAFDGRRPTQQALAARLGIDQTTLSRYLNPKHTSTAPPGIVEALHAHLRAPASELDRARSLSRAALEWNSRQRAVCPGPADRTTSGSTGPDGASTAGVSTRPAGRGPRFRRARPFLALAVTAAVSFAAGLYVDGGLVPAGQAGTGSGQRGAEGAGASARTDQADRADRTDRASEEWPLLYMDKNAVDRYAWGRALQYLLKEHGYDVRADGRFEETTHEAVMDFQEKHQLQADGKVGNHTWPELLEQVAPGDTGPAVRAVQDLLNNVGLGATAVSGHFTAATAEDLKLFQRTHGLPVTGRTDRATWLALLVNQRPPVGSPDYQRPENRSPVPPT
ncbi:peptidoglycan-binding protein [Streptomyces ardesiacus]